MRLVDDEQADRALDARQDVGREAFVGEALRRDQQDIDRVGGEPVVDVVPFVDVAGVDRRGTEPEAFGHRDLVAHEREERADDQRRTMALVAADAGRDPVDEALAPARPLDDERAMPVLDDRLDRLALALAEGRVGAEHGLEMPGEVVHRPGQCGSRADSVVGGQRQWAAGSVQWSAANRSPASMRTGSRFSAGVRGQEYLMS